MPPPDSCSQPRALNASSRFSATFSGSRTRNGFNFISAFFHCDVSTDQRCHISLWAFIGQPLWKVVVTSALLPQWHVLSRQCSDQLLVTVPFLLMHRGHGTAYHLSSKPLHCSPPFGNSWRHICSGSILANFSLPSWLLLWLCKVPLHCSHANAT